VTRRREAQAAGNQPTVVAGAPERADRFATASLIGANLFPLFGAIFLGWDAAAIIVLYWAENLIAGFYNVLRMALVTAKPTVPHAAKLFLIPFFCAHFGGFCLIHGLFLLEFFPLGVATSPLGLERPGWPGPLAIFGIGISLVQQLLQNMPTDMIWALVALLTSHGVSFVENYLVRGEYRTALLPLLMFRPYARMVILHVAIIFGGFLTALVGSPIPLLTILIILKLGLDLYFHRRANRLTGQGPRQDIET